MRHLFSARARRFRPLKAGLAFLAYAAAIIWVWQQEGQKSTWRVEQDGSLQIAAAYLFYGKPFGSIDGGLWDFYLKAPWSQPANLFLASASDRKIPSAETIPTAMEDNALSHAYFAAAALFLFGPTRLRLFLDLPLYSDCQCSCSCCGFLTIGLLRRIIFAAYEHSAMRRGTLLCALAAALLRPGAVN